MDLRREATLLLGFMWKDFSDMALRVGSISAGIFSWKGDLGGDDSRDVLRVPVPDSDVAFDM